jgi:hypothetical protein
LVELLALLVRTTLPESLMSPVAMLSLRAADWPAPMLLSWAVATEAVAASSAATEVLMIRLVFILIVLSKKCERSAVPPLVRITARPIGTKVNYLFILATLSLHLRTKAFSFGDIHYPQMGVARAQIPAPWGRASMKRRAIQGEWVRRRRTPRRR